MKTKPQKAENVTAADVLAQAAKQAPSNESEPMDAEDLPIPTYETEAEVAAALGMYGDSYDKLIAAGKINAPTRAELRDSGHPSGEKSKRAAKKSAKKRSK